MARLWIPPQLSGEYLRKRCVVKSTSLVVVLRVTQAAILPYPEGSHSI
jgi:hypothetical protein